MKTPNTIMELPFKGVSVVLPDFEALVSYIRVKGPLKLNLPEDIGPDVNILECELTIKEK